MPRSTRARRHLAAIAAIAYSILAVVGLVLLAAVPGAVVAQLGITLTVWSGVALALGGLLGAIAARAGVWGLERSALVILAAGVIGYGSTLWSYTGRDLPELLARGGLALALAVLVSYRYASIRGADLDPEV